MILSRLASPTLAAYAIKGANAFAAFLATALLARAAGPSVVGDYGFGVLTATLLGLLALRGLDVIGLRQIAGDLRVEASGSARGVLGYILRAVMAPALLLTAALLLATAAGPLARLLAVDRGSLMAASLGIGSAALLRLGLGVVRACGRPVAAQFFEGLNSFLFAGLIAILWANDRMPGAAGVVLAFFGCQILSVSVIWWRIAREARGWAPAVPADGPALTRAGLPIMAAQGADMFSDWLLLALIAGAASTAEVGAMRVAMQVVMIMFIVVSTGENLLAARIAGDVRAGRSDLVWQRHHRATLAMAVILGPMVLGCVLFPEPLMTLAFGPAFAIAAPALSIMALGQGAKLVTGPSGILLSMAGRERQTLIITLLGFGLMLGTALVLIPLWGLAGAATAHAVTTAFRYGASYVVARFYIRA